MNRAMLHISAILLACGSMSLAASDYVIAVINPTWVVEQSPQYEAARAALQQEVSEREKQLLEQQEELNKLKEDLERDMPMMSEEEAKRLQNDIRARTRRLKFVEAEFRDEIGLRQNELRTKLAEQVEEVVTQLAKEQKIDLILSEGIVYFSKRIDISEQVVERLSKRFESR